jgi:hypothetical protein
MISVVDDPVATAFVNALVKAPSNDGKTAWLARRR